MNTCIFCEIAAGRAPADTVSSSGSFMALHPLNPVTPGHLLVIPRQHVTDALSEPGVTGATMQTAALVAKRMRRFHPEYESVNLITSVGVPATQSVFHLHIHIVPRREGDGLTLPWTGQER
ncbi:histidine triad nucleotide binding protein [Microbacterium phage Fizzles]|nr:histidine triad nucleotide binding protein [Microbacterium phage Fizzles]